MIVPAVFVVERRKLSQQFDHGSPIFVEGTACRLEWTLRLLREDTPLNIRGPMEVDSERHKRGELQRARRHMSGGFFDNVAWLWCLPARSQF